MIRTIHALLCLVFGVAAASEPTTPLAWTTSSLHVDTATADACTPTVLERYVRYAAARVPAEPAPRLQIVVQRFEVGTGCFEGFRPARARVYAKRLDARTGKTGDKPLWSFETEGVAGEVLPWPASGLYRVDMPGCCGALKNEKYFSLLTGEFVASSTAGLLSFETKERSLRVVAAEGSLAASPQGEPGALATVFFGDAEGMREMLVIASESAPPRKGWSAEIAWKGQEPGIRHLGPSAEGLAMLVALKCACDADPLNIEIPLGENGLDERSAKAFGLPDIVLTKKPRDAAPQRTVIAGSAMAGSAEAALQGFLQYLLRPGTNIAKDPVAKKRWLAGDLRKRLADAIAATLAARKAQADGPEAVLPDNGVFLDSWDYPTTCTVTPGPAGRNQAQMAVNCEWGLRTNYPGVTRSGTVSLVREDHEWRIAEIHWHQNAFAASVELGRELDGLTRQAEDIAAGRRPGERP